MNRLEIINEVLIEMRDPVRLANATDSKMEMLRRLYRRVCSTLVHQYRIAEGLLKVPLVGAVGTLTPSAGATPLPTAPQTLIQGWAVPTGDPYSWARGSFKPEGLSLVFTADTSREYFLDSKPSTVGSLVYTFSQSPSRVGPTRTDRGYNWAIVYPKPSTNVVEPPPLVAIYPAPPPGTTANLWTRLSENDFAAEVDTAECPLPAYLVIMGLLALARADKYGADHPDAIASMQQFVDAVGAHNAMQSDNIGNEGVNQWTPE